MVATAARRVVYVERRGVMAERSGMCVGDARGDVDASNAIDLRLLL